MIYAYYRTEIKTGDLLAWSGKRSRTFNEIAQQAIRLFTRSEYHHVGIAWEIAGRIFVIEAVPPLVRIFPLSKLTPFYHIPMGVTPTDYTENFIFQTVGEEYSVWTAIMAYFRKPSPDHQWQCAAYANSFYKSVGIELGDVFTPSDVVAAALELSPHGMRLVQK